TSRSSLSKIVRLPKRMSRPRTRMTASPPGASGRDRGSDAEIGEEDGEESIGKDDEENGFDDRARGELPDALGAARHAQPLVAAGERNDAGKERRLQYADPEGPGIEGRLQLPEEGRDRDAEIGPAHQGAAEQRHGIGEEDDERQGDQHREEARQHEQL